MSCQLVNSPVILMDQHDVVCGEYQYPSHSAKKRASELSFYGRTIRILQYKEAVVLGAFQWVVYAIYQEGLRIDEQVRLRARFAAGAGR